MCLKAVQPTLHVADMNQRGCRNRSNASRNVRMANFDRARPEFGWTGSNFVEVARNVVERTPNSVDSPRQMVLVALMLVQIRDLRQSSHFPDPLDRPYT